VALADREGGKWNMLASQHLSRPAQAHLLNLVETDNVDT
jgi:hypothetical protein